MGFFERIGSIVLETSQAVVDVLALFFQTIYWVVAGPFKRKFPKREGIFSH